MASLGLKAYVVHVPLVRCQSPAPLLCVLHRWLPVNEAIEHMNGNETLN